MPRTTATRGIRSGAGRERQRRRLPIHPEQDKRKNFSYFCKICDFTKNKRNSFFYSSKIDRFSPVFEK
jgi:hypothetical protein